jgi:hypothetical protein
MKVIHINICSLSASAEFKPFSVTLPEHQRQAKEVRLDEAEGEFTVRRCVFSIRLILSLVYILIWTIFNGNLQPYELLVI